MTKLSKADSRRFQRLWASYDDLLWAEGFGEYIQRKRLHALPWARRKNSYFQAYAFTSAMITAYGRAIMDLPERGALVLAGAGLDASEASMHMLMLKRRHEIFAHSDPRLSKAIPVVYGDQDQYSTVISNFPLTSFTAEEIVVALKLIAKLKTEISCQREGILVTAGFGSKPAH